MQPKQLERIREYRQSGAELESVMFARSVGVKGVGQSQSILNNQSPLRYPTDNLSTSYIEPTSEIKIHKAGELRDTLQKNEDVSRDQGQRESGSLLDIPEAKDLSVIDPQHKQQEGAGPWEGNSEQIQHYNSELFDKIKAVLDQSGYQLQYFTDFCKRSLLSSSGLNYSSDDPYKACIFQVVDCTLDSQLTRQFLTATLLDEQFEVRPTTTTMLADQGVAHQHRNKRVKKLFLQFFNYKEASKSTLECVQQSRVLEGVIEISALKFIKQQESPESFKAFSRQYLLESAGDPKIILQTICNAFGFKLVVVSQQNHGTYSLQKGATRIEICQKQGQYISKMEEVP